MTGWRFRNPRAVRGALCLFIASVAVPRPGLFFHVHVDGDHVHVHDDSPGAEEPHGGNHDSLHHHHSDDGTLTDPDAEIEAPEPAHLGHWHWQSPFHRVAPVAFILLDRSELVQRISRTSERDSAVGSLFSAHARAPPPLPCC